jgi:DNA-binding transcriptional MerR regulator
MSKQTQIALDFGQEPATPPPPAENAGGGESPSRPYMAAAGVGVRIKSYKQTPASQTGDLFGDTPAETVPPETAGPTLTEAVTTIVEEPAAVPEMPAVIVEEPTAIVDEPVLEEPTVEEPAAVTAAAVLEPAPAPTITPEDEITPEVKRSPAAKRPAAKQGPSKRGRKSLKQVGIEADLIEIPTDEVLFSKQYYTMGEVSEMFRVNQSLLRFWETEFDILQPKKNKKGDRYFRPVDIKNLHLIYHLLRQKKYTIEGAKDFLKNNKKADERFEVIQRLEQIKAFLQEMKAQL